MLRVVDSAAVTDVGRVRKGNEDSHLLQAPLFVVADGMGGAQAGEVASQIAVDAFKRPLDESLAPEPRLAGVVRSANKEIFLKSHSDESFKGMGTTLTAMLLGDDAITIAHVGDSRAYRLRDGELERLTRDHSLVGEMVRRGAISEAEAEVHPQRSILTRALGPEDIVDVDTLSHAVRSGDIYLICSDGLTGMVDEATIAEEMGSGASMREVAERLIRRANENGGIDNITVVAFRLGGGENEAATAAQVGQQGDSGDETISAPAIVVPDAPPADLGDPRRPTGDGPQTAAGGGKVQRTVGSRVQYERRRDQSKRSRRWVGGIVIGFVLIAGVIGAVVGSLNVYFLGGNDQGLVTVYRGLPYDLPLSVSLYTRDYVTATPVSELPPQLRARILDHKLRTRGDALDLAQQIDAGKINSDDAKGINPLFDRSGQ